MSIWCPAFDSMGRPTDGAESEARGCVLLSAVPPLLYIGKPLAGFRQGEKAGNKFINDFSVDPHREARAAGVGNVVALLVCCAVKRGVRHAYSTVTPVPLNFPPGGSIQSALVDSKMVAGKHGPKICLVYGPTMVQATGLFADRATSRGSVWGRGDPTGPDP